MEVLIKPQKWVKWIAIDGDGEIFGFEEKPYAVPSLKSWWGFKRRMFLGVDRTTDWKEHWETSLKEYQIYLTKLYYERSMD
jgi:hypothetical protein